MSMPDSMIERVAKAAWETSLLRDVSKPDGVQTLSWEDLLLSARSDPMACALYKRTMHQAHAILNAMREPTPVILKALRESVPVNGCEWEYAEEEGPDCWRAMIDAALDE